MWFDYDRDGLLDLLICNYVRWTPKTDVFCSADGKTKSYCTPEAYRGTTSWLYRNKGERHLRGRDGQGRPVRRDVEVARRDAARLRPGRLARSSSSPTTRSRTSSIATTATARSRAGRCRRAWRSAKKAAPAPAWAPTPPTWTTAARRRWPSPTSPARCSACTAPVGAGRLRRSRARFGRSAGPRARRSASAASSSTRISTACRICSSSTATSTIVASRPDRPRQLRRVAAPVPQPRQRAVHRHRRAKPARRSRSPRSAAAPRSATSMRTATSTS